MHILLIQAYLGRGEPPVAPLGLASLAAHLTEHQVKIFDPNLSTRPFEETVSVIEDFKPDIVGFSLRNVDTTKYSDQFYYFEHFRKFVGSLAKTFPGMTIVVGGAGFSLFPVTIMERIPEIEVGFYLEGEWTFSQFVKNGTGGSGIPGLFIRSSQNIELTGPPPRMAFDDLLPPAWEIVDVSAYLPYAGKASIGIEAKRGCALKCAYCTYPLISGDEVRIKPAYKVVDELVNLKERFGVDRIFFCDPVFNYPSEHAESICREILDRNLNIRWGAYHQDRFLTAEYIRLATESGCDEFYFSPDAATNEGLKILNKVSTVKSLHRSLHLIAGEGRARTSYNFFAAVPGTGWKNWLAAVRFLIKAKLKLGKRLTRWKLSYIRLEPLTPLAKEILGERTGAEPLLPSNSRELNRLFLRKSRSVLLNVLLSLHYCLGKRFGRKNLIGD